MRKKISKKNELRNGVRVDTTYSNLLRQFNLHGSSSKKETKVTVPRSGRFSPRPSSILYMCLFLGLSIGIGSAFADREIFPSQKPLDQPVRQKTEASHSSSSKEKAKVEILPQEQKQELILEKSNRLAQEQKEKSHEQAVLQEDNETKNAKNHHASATQPTLATEKTKSATESKSSEKSKANVGKTVPTTIASSSTHAFKTEAGGQLPATASNNMNNVLLGLFLTFAGFVLTRTKRTDLQ